MPRNRLFANRHVELTVPMDDSGCVRAGLTVVETGTIRPVESDNI